MKECPEHVEGEYLRLWYAAQITLRANGGEDPEKIAVLKANYEHSERLEN